MVRTFQFHLNEAIVWKRAKICEALLLCKLDETREES